METRSNDLPSSEVKRLLWTSWPPLVSKKIDTNGRQIMSKMAKSQIPSSVSRHPGRTGKSCCVCHFKQLQRQFIQNQESAILPQKKLFKNIVLGMVENKTKHIVTEVKCFWDQQSILQSYNACDKIMPITLDPARNCLF